MSSCAAGPTPVPAGCVVCVDALIRLLQMGVGHPNDLHLVQLEDMSLAVFSDFKLVDKRRLMDSIRKPGAHVGLAFIQIAT